MLCSTRLLCFTALVIGLAGCFDEFPGGRVVDGGADLAPDGDGAPPDQTPDAPRSDADAPDGASVDAADPGDLAFDDRGVDAAVCLPADEVCNGGDDDCDGRIDERLRRPCPLQAGVCAGTTTGCEDGVFGVCDYATLVGETYTADELGRCDGLDNDCDDAVDEDCDCEPGAQMECGGPAVGRCRPGLQVCDEHGLWGPCQDAVGPLAETCNGIDDDCDGAVDEALPAEPCASGREGACGPGLTACRAGAVACDPVEMPRDEVCDGVDEDCDGRVDEETDGEPCPLDGQGPCAEGRSACAEGGLACEQVVFAVDEVCNGEDDDCDGAIDEALDGSPCQRLGAVNCAAGTLSCAAGRAECVYPAEQLRDGIDEDCDGQVDEFPAELDVFDLADGAIGGLGVRPGLPPGLAFAHPGPLARDGFFPRPIDSAGNRYNTAFDVGDGAFWRPHAKGPGQTINAPVVSDYGDPEQTSVLETHANYGITFDLQAIGRYTRRPVLRFRARAGVSTDVRWAWIVLVDGNRVRREVHNGRREDVVDVDVEGARFLTLLMTDGDRDIGSRHTYWGNPLLDLGARQGP